MSDLSSVHFARPVRVARSSGERSVYETMRWNTIAPQMTSGRSPPYMHPPARSMPRIVAVGFRRINKMLQELAPVVADRAVVDVLDVGFEEAVARVKALQARQPVDVVVAAGSNGGYLRQHLDVPVVLVKVGGFDLMHALAQARRVSDRIGLVTYDGMAPDLQRFEQLFDFAIAQRSYRTEDEARACVRALQQGGTEVVVGSGVAVDVAEQLGLTGLFLYSMDAVREALADAVEVARAARIQQAKRERLNTLLAQLSDGVIAVDTQERIETLNPAMAQWLGIDAGAWQGRRLSAACPELSLQSTLRLGLPELEKIERVRGRQLIVNRIPIVEQGVLTGAVLSAQDAVAIQRVDRHIRARAHSQAASARYDLSQLAGRSAATQRVQALALQCAHSSATVLLLGESGTGKELVAQGIHRASDRRDMPFVAVNCAALSETLLESELFGHEEGAFTGARRGGKIGLFEAAHKGTIFLDEIGEMPLALQTRMLRVLQEREVLRVGAVEPTPVQVRVIAATHRDLAEQVAQGRFRLDLYYRLNILRIEVPPLRERLADIPDIAATLLAKVRERLGTGEGKGWGAVWQALMAQAPHHSWPGNVRELDNLIERLVVCVPPAAVLSSAEATQWLRELAPELCAVPGAVQSPSGGEDRQDIGGRDGRAHALRPAQRLSEREHILATLAECGEDKALACQRLGISRTTLWRKLRAG
ncbi:propionate catabolism operon transcriptional regulator [Aquabacterium commune]|uniref:Propionate catabolism operon transcriptional regulator n=2 Tax=Aquabacterium commune TaxID=70586 RepID=A0A4R6RPK0_9BURK|nr:propionate catabolism operon transcriptional regulator [Aquabacterium commune]